MNFGLVFLALFLIGGSILGMFFIAQSAQTPYVDTFGNTTTPRANLTHGIIENGTAAVGGAAGGLALLLTFFTIVVAAIWVVRSISRQSGSGR